MKASPASSQMKSKLIVSIPIPEEDDISSRKGSDLGKKSIKIYISLKPSTDKLASILDSRSTDNTEKSCMSRCDYQYKKEHEQYPLPSL